MAILDIHVSFQGRKQLQKRRISQGPFWGVLSVTLSGVVGEGAGRRSLARSWKADFFSEKYHDFHMLFCRKNKSIDFEGTHMKQRK